MSNKEYVVNIKSLIIKTILFGWPISGLSALCTLGIIVGNPIILLVVFAIINICIILFILALYYDYIEITEDSLL